MAPSPTGGAAVSAAGPDTVMQELNTLIGRLRDTTRPLTAQEQRQAHDMLGDVYNLLSATQRKPPLQWALMSQGAASHRTQEALSGAVKALEEHKTHVESMYRGADAFLKALQ